jgi:hypothetical protein
MPMRRWWSRWRRVCRGNSGGCAPSGRMCGRVAQPSRHGWAGHLSRRRLLVAPGEMARVIGPILTAAGQVMPDWFALAVSGSGGIDGSPLGALGGVPPTRGGATHTTWAPDLKRTRKAPPPLWGRGGVGGGRGWILPYR